MEIMQKWKEKSILKVTFWPVHFGIFLATFTIIIVKFFFFNSSKYFGFLCYISANFLF